MHPLNIASPIAPMIHVQNRMTSLLSKAILLRTGGLMRPQIASRVAD